LTVVRLLLHDTIATAPLTFPLSAGWLEPAFSFELRTTLRAADVGSTDAALVPSAEIAILQETHVVLPDVAVIAEQIGCVAMRTPLRPDEVGPTPVRLWDASGSAEILARATVQPFYGILPTAWTPDDSAQARVVVLEGATAIQPPEAGFTEDLIRSWFILAGQPFVSHLLVVPKDLSRGDVDPVLSALANARDLAHDRRRDLRRTLAERHELDRDRIAAIHNAQRYRLEEDDQRALIMLLQKGNKGSAYPYPWEVPYFE
jgi:predicted solute-binding protein